MTSAEVAYLFRHALVRDAAYEMQLPSDRAELHELALHLIEDVFGGRAPAPPPLEDLVSPGTEPADIDVVAAELAAHAEAASMLKPELNDLRKLYLIRAAAYQQSKHQTTAAAKTWLSVASMCEGAECGVALDFAGIMLEVSGRGDQAREVWLQSTDLLASTGAHRALATALANLSNHYRRTAKLGEAHRCLREALTIAQQHELPDVETVVQGRFSAVYRLMRKKDDALVANEAALKLARETGNRKAEGVALGRKGIAEMEAGDLTSAAESAKQALEINRETNDLSSEATTLGLQGQVYFREGRMELAETAFGASLELALRVGDRYSQGMSLADLANVYQDTGRDEQALQAFETALEIARDVGDTRNVAYALGKLGGLYHRMDRLDDADRLFDEAIALHRKAANRAGEGAIYVFKSSVLRDLGRLQEAEQLALQGIDIARETQNRGGEGGAQGTLGGILFAAGRLQEANAAYEVALAIHRGLGRRSSTAVMCCELAALKIRLGETRKAHELWQEGSTALAEIGDTFRLQRARHAIDKQCAEAGLPPLQ